MRLTPRTRSVAVARPRTRSVAVARAVTSQSANLHLRFRVPHLPIELLELLDVHPAMARTDGSEEGQDLGVAEFCRGIAQDEAAAIMVDEGDPAVRGWEYHGAAVAYHLQFHG